MTVYTDGGSRGNPGPAAAAYILKDAAGKTTGGKAFFLNQTTNNIAEYNGILRGLEAAKAAGSTQIELLSDSELIIRQIHGQYKVKSDNLRELFCQAMERLTGFKSWQARHIPREQNKEADALANRAMDAQQDVELAVQCDASTAKPVRLGVLISGGGRTMENLDKLIKAGKLSAEIACVICSRREIKGVDLARKLGFEPVIIRVRDYPEITQFSTQIAKTLDA
ncbi:MAG: ribonuclease HI family protein, partial [Anaerohalosphaeraceae bacterium]